MGMFMIPDFTADAPFTAFLIVSKWNDNYFEKKAEPRDRFFHVRRGVCFPARLGSSEHATLRWGRNVLETTVMPLDFARYEKMDDDLR
jgi:hypothetical protein